MSRTLEEISREARLLPRRDRLALARILLEPDETESAAAAEAAWDEEIRARVLAVEKGRAEEVTFEAVKARVEKLLGRLD